MDSESDFYKLIKRAMIALAKEVMVSDPSFWASIPDECPRKATQAQQLWWMTKQYMEDDPEWRDTPSADRPPESYRPTKAELLHAKLMEADARIMAESRAKKKP